ncbi:MAG: hypothetical protein GF308_06445 [Candidatus Heimdallarchaeota archaeon]|nr:hypothetical protein [Candidatus Heimdallarchaeota archaeon]
MQDEPLATLRSIAKKVDMSISGTSLRINRLIEEAKAVNRIHIDLNHDALGLEIHSFFYKIDSKNSLEKLEQVIGYYHPYTLYLGRCFGKFSGLLVQYQIPKNSLSYLQNLADYLKEMNYIKDYNYVKSDKQERGLIIKSSIRSWNPESETWHFDWKNWKEHFVEVSPSSQPQKTSKTILERLSKLDIQLLAQLTLDGRKKNIDIIRDLNIEHQSGIAQKVSRRINFLKENVISDYRLFLNWAFFDLYQTIIIHSFCSKELARKLRNYLLLTNEQNKRIFPFGSRFHITEDGFFWYVKAPPSHISELMDFIWEFYPKHDLFWISYKHSHVYGLWPETFDEQKKQWKVSKQFMIDPILKRL